jgi:hypothetical protein
LAERAPTPNNIYRLIVRQATPDFSLAAWAIHMTLRNGDRASLSKPMALRAGDSRAFEVAVQRRDGFDGEIDISMENLPPGVTAAGLKIGKGKPYGHLILTASSDAKRGFLARQDRRQGHDQWRSRLTSLSAWRAWNGP